MKKSEYNYLWNQHYQLRVQVLTNLLYQQKRHAVMDWRDKSIKAAVAVSGALVFAQIAVLSSYTYALGAFISLAACALVYFDFSAKAFDALSRVKQWHALQAEMEKVGLRGFDEAAINEWKKQASLIESAETAANKVLLMGCNADAVAALGGELECTYKPSLWPFWLRFIP